MGDIFAHVHRFHRFAVIAVQHEIGEVHFLAAAVAALGGVVELHQLGDADIVAQLPERLHAVVKLQLVELIRGELAKKKVRVGVAERDGYLPDAATVSGPFELFFSASFRSSLASAIWSTAWTTRSMRSGSTVSWTTLMSLSP